MCIYDDVRIEWDDKYDQGKRLNDQKDEILMEKKKEKWGRKKKRRK